MFSVHALVFFSFNISSKTIFILFYISTSSDSSLSTIVAIIIIIIVITIIIILTPITNNLNGRMSYKSAIRNFYVIKIKKILLYGLLLTKDTFCA